jgi:type 1 fimbria pilin
MKLNKIMLAAVMAMGVSSFAANAVDAGHGKVTFKGSIWIGPYISIHFLSLNP